MPATEFHSTYKALEPAIAHIRLGNLRQHDFFQLSLKAALTKTYDFNTYVSGLEDTGHSFYLTATLRGMCEDIIALKSMLNFDPKDRSDLVANIQMSGVYESIAAQMEFFKTTRPARPVFSVNDPTAEKEKVDAKILNVYKKYGLPTRGKLPPSMRQLAIRCGLLPIYDFYYSATSKWVHFSPHILMRMGWGPESSPTATYEFSPSHFSGYYANFNFMHGTYLFVLFVETFKQELGFTIDVDPHIQELKDLLDRILRWSEVVTFEEMNVKPPSEILYATLKVLEEEKAKGDV
jgi:hypothetical protein